MLNAILVRNYELVWSVDFNEHFSVYATHKSDIQIHLTDLQTLLT